MRRNLGSIFSCLALISLILVVYLPITKTFYLQDEWLGYGLYLTKGTGMILQSTGSLLGAILGQGRILTNLLYFLFYQYSSLNIFPVAVFAITLHIVNTLVVFLLAKRLFRNTLSAFLGSLFFAVNSVSQSAITWSAASVNTLPSTTLILISLILYFKYLKSSRVRWIILSFVTVYLSLLFKETGVFMLLLLPLFSLVYKKQTTRDFIKTYWYYLASVFLIVAYRIWGFRSESGDVALFLTGSSKYFYESLVVRSILYPLTSFSLSIVPPELFLNFARYLTNVYYPFIPEAQFILIAQTVVLDVISIVLSGIIIFIIFMLLKITTPRVKKFVVMWLVFLFVSFLPYIIISKNFSYLESRYYYLASAVWGVIFAWVASLIAEKIKSKYIKAAFLIIFILFLYIHASIVIKDINKLVGESQTRINILNQLSEIKPKLDGKKNVVLVTGDTDYYLPGNKVPFQQGFGYTLMAVYYPSGNIPREFLKEGYLFDIGSQGIKESGEYAFGYFSNSKELEVEIKRYKIQSDSVLRLYYNSKNGRLMQI
ncbi:MAG: hypothetical protein AAB656_00670 [Patescibacteria group bacterium]